MCRTTIVQVIIMSAQLGSRRFSGSVKGSVPSPQLYHPPNRSAWEYQLTPVGVRGILSLALTASCSEWDIGAVAQVQLLRLMSTGAVSCRHSCSDLGASHLSFPLLTDAAVEQYVMGEIRDKVLSCLGVCVGGWVVQRALTDILRFICRRMASYGCYTE